MKSSGSVGCIGGRVDKKASCCTEGLFHALGPQKPWGNSWAVSLFPHFFLENRKGNISVTVLLNTLWKKKWIPLFFQNHLSSNVQFISVAQLCPTLCDPMDCSTPGLPVHCQLPEFTHTHVRWVKWCHPTISSSVITFSSHLQSFPPSGSFQMSQLFASGGQSIGVSASASVLPMNVQDWLPLGWTGWISLQSKGFSRVFSNTTVQKHQFFGTQLSL